MECRIQKGEVETDPVGIKGVKERFQKSRITVRQRQSELES